MEDMKKDPLVMSAFPGLKQAGQVAIAEGGLTKIEYFAAHTQVGVSDAWEMMKAVGEIKGFASVQEWIREGDILKPGTSVSRFTMFLQFWGSLRMNLAMQTFGAVLEEAEDNEKKATEMLG